MDTILRRQPGTQQEWELAVEELLRVRAWQWLAQPLGVRGGQSAEEACLLNTGSEHFTEEDWKQAPIVQMAQHRAAEEAKLRYITPMTWWRFDEKIADWPQPLKRMWELPLNMQAAEMDGNNPWKARMCDFSDGLARPSDAGVSELPSFVRSFDKKEGPKTFYDETVARAFGRTQPGLIPRRLDLYNRAVRLLHNEIPEAYRQLFSDRFGVDVARIKTKFPDDHLEVKGQEEYDENYYTRNPENFIEAAKTWLEGNRNPDQRPMVEDTLVYVVSRAEKEKAQELFQAAAFSPRISLSLVALVGRAYGRSPQLPEDPTPLHKMRFEALKRITTASVQPTKSVPQSSSGVLSASYRSMIDTVWKTFDDATAHELWDSLARSLQQTSGWDGTLIDPFQLLLKKNSDVREYELAKFAAAVRTPVLNIEGKDISIPAPDLKEGAPRTLSVVHKGRLRLACFRRMVEDYTTLYTELAKCKGVDLSYEALSNYQYLHSLVKRGIVSLDVIERHGLLFSPAKKNSPLWKVNYLPTPTDGRGDSQRSVRGDEMPPLASLLIREWRETVTALLVAGWNSQPSLADLPKLNMLGTVVGTTPLPTNADILAAVPLLLNEGLPEAHPAPLERFAGMLSQERLRQGVAAAAAGAGPVAMDTQSRMARTYRKR